jgi:hypothetical protein
MDRAAAGPGPAEDSDYRSGTGCAQGPHSTAALSEAGGFRARLVKVARRGGNWLKISRRHPELDLVIFQSTFPGTGKLWWHAVSPVGQITAMNNQQFLAVVGVIIVALIVYLSYERFRECQDLGGSHCYFGRRR